MNLLDNLLTHLVTEGIVRRPSVPGVLPPMFNDPRDGVPAPAAVNGDAALGIFQTGGIRPAPRMDELRNDIVDIWIRTKTSPRALELEEEIRDALIDKVDWLMGGLWVSESLQWRPLQRFVSNADAYTFITAYIFERRAT